MVTAELATGLTVAVTIFALGLQAMALGVDEVRCVDAVRVAARAASRGDDPGASRALALARSPHGSVVTVGRQGADAVVTVTAPGRGLLARLGVPPATATARVPVEDLGEPV